MKFCFLNVEKELLSAVTEVLPDLHVVPSDEKDADVVVSVEERTEGGLAVSLDGARASIAYGGGRARFFRALALLADLVRSGKRTGEISETPLFLTNGAMVDMSRNAVMNVRNVKHLMRKMALMGMNTFMLYTEDTYELADYPYFGYMRGRYTREELKELDAYALTLGIELIPCIQVLGHLKTMLRWAAMAPYKDTESVLLAGSEDTYRLIDAMLSTAEECFTSRRIHLGMDETHDLGSGKYLDKFGLTERSEIFLSHLRRVSEMAHAHGFSPMMWSDMFFRLSARGMEGYKDYDKRTVIPDEIARLVPRDVQQVFWDYYHSDEEFYSINLEKHKLFGDNTLFAGGVWLWSGHSPLFTRSLSNTIPALDACKKHGVKEVIATVWHNGGESLHVLSLAGLAWYADYDYTGSYNEESVKRTFRAATLADYDDFLLTERPALPHGGAYGAMTAILYNDPLLGMMDPHFEGLDTRAYYTECRDALERAEKGEYESAFRMMRALADLLIEKADFGIRLTEAYRLGERETLSSLADECDVIVRKIRTLRDVHRDAWMEYYKPFGFETLDLRYGGMVARFETARARILAYLAGEIDGIEELECDRLRFDGGSGDTKITGRFLWYRQSSIASAGVL